MNLEDKLAALLKESEENQAFIDSNKRAFFNPVFVLSIAYSGRINEMTFHIGAIARKLLKKQSDERDKLVSKLFATTVLFARIVNLKAEEIVAALLPLEKPNFEESLLQLLVDMSYIVGLFKNKDNENFPSEDMVAHHIKNCLDDIFAMANGLKISNEELCDITQQQLA